MGLWRWNDNYFKRAELCRERLGPVLRRLTVNYPPIMFHPLNMITAYKGQVIYDTPETQAKAATPIPQLTWIPAKGAQTPAAAQNPADLQALLDRADRRIRLRLHRAGPLGVAH